MNFKRLSLSLLFSFAALLSVIAADTDTRQQAFSPSFQTLKAIKNGNFLLSPVITIGSDDFITFSFDEIGDDSQQLQYRLIHCNADWQPSQLLESEYLPRFNVADIDDFAFSSNTYIHYVNYAFTIPNEEIAPLISGNYIVQVFDRYSPDDTLLQFRFSAVAPLLTINAFADGHTDRGHNADLQQVAVSVVGNIQEIPNPFQDLKLVVMQNRRPDSMRTITNPFRVDRDNIFFEHNNNLIFPAGNEYRRFETVRTDYPGLKIDSVALGDNIYHAWISQDTPRSYGSYSYDSTQFGRFFIREHNATDSDLGADYVMCHFSLIYPESDNAQIYLEGDLSQHLDSDNFLLKHESGTNLYYLDIPLKQGSYNYQFLRKMSDGNLSTYPIEGNFFETKNQYDIYLFMRAPGQRADQLIGFSSIISD